MRNFTLFILLGLLNSCVKNNPNSIEIQHFTVSASTRKGYEPVLEKLFSDNRLHVQVTITGDSSEILSLENNQFNQAMAGRFIDEGLYDKWQEMGFKKVVMIGGNGGFKKEQDLFEN